MGRAASLVKRFPDFFKSQDPESLFYRLLEVFGQTLDDAEADLIRVMHAHWVDTANNDGSQGLGTAHKGDLDQIFALYLENLGGTSQLKPAPSYKLTDAAFAKLRQIGIPENVLQLLGALVIKDTDTDAEKQKKEFASKELFEEAVKKHIGAEAAWLYQDWILDQAKDAPYRERIKALIQVLHSGASTKDGIIAVVAANLGLIGDEPEVVKTRAQIRIEEFLPAPQTTSLEIALSQDFNVNNPNPGATIPEIRLQVLESFQMPIVNPRLIQLATGKIVAYQGSMTNTDLLSFFPNGAVTLNGVAAPPKQVAGWPSALPPGASAWRLEAAVGFAQGRFDETRYDYAAFDIERLNSDSRFDGEDSRFDTAVFAILEPAVQLEVTVNKLTPGAFRVCIPWDIPGGFVEHPQIRYIVDKVKAAGVLAVIAYEKLFKEPHELSDRFSGQAQRTPFPEEHAIEEANFDLGSIHTPEPGGIVHEMTETFITSGVFDYTTFNSLNTFG